MAAIRKTVDEKFAAQEARIEELEAQLESSKGGEQFSKKNKKSGESGEAVWKRLS